VRVLRRLRASESGYTLIEMLTVMAIMGVVMGGITTLFVSGINAEADQNNRFQAQLNARLALDKIRREVHCSAIVTLSGTASGGYSPNMSEDASACGGQFSYCTAAFPTGATTRFRLYRQSGASCASNTGTLLADYLTKGTIFAFTPQSTASLAKLTVDIPVNVKPARASETYELKDDIVLRNSTRT
jgi:prepilin-type N-terminal cleavage/methylation domain-containing protein